MLLRGPVIREIACSWALCFAFCSEGDTAIRGNANEDAISALIGMEQNMKSKLVVALILCMLMAFAALSGCQSSAGSASSGSSAAAAASQASASASASAVPANGVYSINVKSSASMVRVTSCELTVENGTMTAKLNLSGDGYEKLFLGTAEQADSSSQDDWCMWSDEDGDGKYSYTVAVEALDTPIDCAAYSFKRERWYDRQLTFQSDTLTPISK